MFAKRSGIEQYEIIKSIVHSTGCQKYLELGISKGINMQHVASVCPDCTGVDILDISTFRDFKFHVCSTDEFFRNNQQTFDVIFIDADHRFHQVKKDFENSINILNKYGIIFIHDTDPISKDYTKKDFCWDSYHIVSHIQTVYIDWNIITIPISVTGLSIINRVLDRRIFEYLG